VVADRCQIERLLAWAASFGFERTWAIESVNGLGKLLAQQLVGAGEHVVDVPATLSARIVLLSSTKQLAPLGLAGGGVVVGEWF
jgi:hypothetical protein